MHKFLLRVYRRFKFLKEFMIAIIMLSRRIPARHSLIRVRIEKIENTQLMTSVLQVLLTSGRRVALTPTFKTLANSAVYGRLWYGDSRIVLDMWPWRAGKIVYSISDTAPADVLVEGGGYSEWSRQGYFPTNCLPLGVNPRIGFGSQMENIHRFRTAERRLRLFFAGNCNPSIYDSGDLAAAFQIRTRSQLVRDVSLALKKEDPSGAQWEIRDFHWSRMQSSGLERRVDESEWLKSISESYFFLCPPGTTTPMCHNTIEAMAVGTVPVLEYTTLFSPPLEHGVNCIDLSLYSDLECFVREVFVMSEGEWSNMSRAVSAYYDEHISPISVITRMERDLMENGCAHLLFHSEPSAQKFSKDFVVMAAK